jgi:hypothetical protein
MGTCFYNPGMQFEVVGGYEINSFKFKGPFSAREKFGSALVIPKEIMGRPPVYTKDVEWNSSGGTILYIDYVSVKYFDRH